MKKPQSQPSKWIRFEIPPQMVGSFDRIAQTCGWRHCTEGSSTQVCLEERYQSQRPSLVELLPVIDSNGKSGPGWDRIPSLPSDAGINQQIVENEIRRLIALGTSEAFWSAWKLLATAAPDEVVHANIPNLHGRVAELAPGASLWIAAVDPLAMKRFAFIRLLFSAQNAPELLARPPDRFEGFVSTRGLGSGPMTLSIDTLVALYCTWQAPWIVGIAVPRIPSVFITLTNSPWDGITDPPTALLDLFSPHVLSTTSRNVYPRPDIDSDLALAGLKWWIRGCNRLLSCLLDPANFGNQGVYDPTIHFTTILSIDRFVGSALGALNAYRRQEYVRKLFLFEALETLEGLEFGSYEQMCDTTALERHLDELKTALPPEAAQILLPRCERAVQGLKTLSDGFISERWNNGKIIVKRKDGGLEELSEPRATSAYLRAIRNATHSYKEIIKNPRSLSLLAGHSGEIDGSVADIALLHLLRIIADPQSVLFERQRRG